MAFVYTLNGRWWADTAHPVDPTPENIEAVVYAHPTEFDTLLIQWLREGYKPYTRPAEFYETDVRLLRTALEDGYTVWVQMPGNTRCRYRAHDSHLDLLDITAGRSYREDESDDPG